MDRFITDNKKLNLIIIVQIDMRSLFCLFLLLTVGSIVAMAQDPYPEKPVAPAPTSLEALIKKPIFNHSNLVDSLIVWHAQENSLQKGVRGYRLQIYFSSGTDARSEIQKIKTRFLRVKPDVNTYTTYSAPDFKLRVGDFRSKSEALKLKKSLSSMFPDSFIVPEIIDPNY
ncbi:SPOR domain-containing protein [Halosquirtibacter xylanolyticus]|uniref:SPOR domain-containing protein n=1 Tax=Halosquirtibacter xylanolyticus TaxID=3374599 RepID=UPI003747C22A|nr:SPOR domain-containing protein [Prolixibacteraceae bacterium]